MAEFSENGVAALAIQIHSGLIQALETSYTSGVMDILDGATKVAAELKGTEIRAEFVNAVAYTLRFAAGQAADLLGGSSKRIFTTGEAARICKISQQTIVRCCDSGRLTSFRVPGSRSRRIERSVLLHFMRDNKIAISKGDSFNTMSEYLAASGVSEWQEALNNPILDNTKSYVVAMRALSQWLERSGSR